VGETEKVGIRKRGRKWERGQKQQTRKGNGKSTKGKKRCERTEKESKDRKSES
jgi:hypothetical protein